MKRIKELEARYDYLGRFRSALLDVAYEALTIELAAPTLEDVAVSQELRVELSRRIQALDEMMERVYAESCLLRDQMGVWK